MTNKDKLDADFSKFNLNIKQATEKEMNRLREEIDTLKEKAYKMSEKLLSPSSQ